MLTITATGRYSKCVSDEVITAGSVGIPAVFNLNEDFDGLAVTAVFRGSGTSCDRVLTTNNTTIPREAVAVSGGILEVGVYAKNGEGDIVIPTVWSVAGTIREGAIASGIDPSEPEPDWTAQVQIAAAEAVQTANEAKDIAEAAEEAAISGAESALNSATAAAASAEIAQTMAVTASTAAESAQASMDTALSLADSVYASEQVAVSSATAAEAAKISAETAATNAASSASAAEAAKIQAVNSAAAAVESAEHVHEDLLITDDILIQAQSVEQNVSDLYMGTMEAASVATEQARNAAASARVATSGAEDAQEAQEAAESARDDAQSARETAKAARDDTLAAVAGIENVAADIQSMFATLESDDRASQDYAVGDLLVYDGSLYKVTSEISLGDMFIPDGNIEPTTIEQELAVANADVTDVRLNGVSAVQNGIANIPAASTTAYGVVRIGNGLQIYNGSLTQNTASDAQIKLGITNYYPITPGKQNAAVFYGLAKAAGDNTQSASTNPVGTYTGDAKTAIRNMLGVPDNSELAFEHGTGTSSAQQIGTTADASGTGAFAHGVQTEASDTASHAEGYQTHATGQGAHAEGYKSTARGYFTHAEGNNTLASGNYAHTEGSGTSAAGNYSHAEGIGTVTKHLAQHVAGTYNIIDPSAAAATEKGTYAEIIGNGTSASARSNARTLDWDGNEALAGDLTINAGGADEVTVGEAISNTQAMLATVETGTTASKAYAIGELLVHDGTLYRVISAITLGDTLILDGNIEQTTVEQELSVANNDVTDVQINGSSIVSNGVANIPFADSNSGPFGIVGLNSTYGITINNSQPGHYLYLVVPSELEVKNGTAPYKAISPYRQHISAFYGLAKAAGADEKNSSLTLGQYTENAKSAIHEMLNGPVEVTGTTPVITALPGISYKCNEVSTLDITLPAFGCIDVIFESGSTPTVLTVTPPTGQTVRWANGFDPSALEADTTYEINICDGLGVAASWGA